MKKRFLSLLCVLALCLGLLPVTALAAAPIGQVLYVGGVQISSTGYWTTDSDGNVTASTAGETPTDNYISYDAENNVLTLHNATIKNELEFNESIEGGTFISGSAIGVFNKSGNAELTISLVGTNTIANVGKGIFVLASSASTGSSNLTIQGDGSLNASASQTGIWVQSNGNNAALCVENAEVTASPDGAVKNGVLVQAKDGSDVSLTVNGGSLTASVNANIWFQFGSGVSGSGTPTVTVSNNAIVRANGGITNNSSTSIQYGTGNEENGGIVFDGSAGTVYGSVTLQDDLEIKSGETLTVPDGSSLNCNGNLTNNGTILASGGTVTGSLSGGTAVTTPSITAQPTGQTVTEGSAAMFSVTASNAQTYQWQQSTDNGSSWANIESATSASYTISSTATDMSNYQYRCVVKSASGVGVISNAATLTVTEKTEPTTYTISTAEQLYAFAEAVNTGNTTANAILTADIDLGNKAWTPIGKDDSHIYNGTFDGQGHTISGLQCSVSSGDVAGLFGVIGSSGVVKNVGIADSDVSVVVTVTDKIAYAGGVCGYSAGIVENCWNSGSVTATCNGSNNDRNAAYAGGVCGWNDGIIRNCWNSGAVKAESTTASCVGGVCGYSNKTVENCWNSGSVSGIVSDTDSKYNVGGVCGHNIGTITNCYWLAGTAEYGIGNPRGDTNAESKTAEQFASGEVAWLLNQGQTGTPWGQGSNNMPVLEGNLPAGVTSYVPVRITIVMTDNTQKSYYSAKGSTFTEYPTGYAFFFKENGTQTWINKGTQTYDADATIYAENMTLEKIPAKAATCTENGNSEYWYCAAFDKYFKDENGVNEITAKDTVIPATGHGESEVKGAKEATCTEDGYTGDKVCKVCGEILERGTVIEKIGHVWGEPEWNLSEDGKTCTVTFTCKNNPEHKETPQVSVTSAVKTPATCTESGVTTYTAAVEFNGQTYTDTKEVSVPATGHELKKTDAKEPTCTEDGNKEYWTCDTCDKYFSDENAETEIQLADTVIEATGHSYDNGKCTVCGEIDPDFKAVIIEGANGTWQKGTKDGLSFTSNAAFADFQKVQVDGKDLDASNYTVKEGSTIVTLKAEYLETLSVGKHTLAIVSDTGTATTEFTIKAAAVTDDTQSPQTGDNSNMMLWIALMLIAVCGLTGAMVYGQKKKYGK